MDILRKYKQNGYFTAELFHLLSKKKLVEVQEEISPSEYEKELKMSTAERISSLNNIVIENIVVNSENKKQAILSFLPKIIIFQNFTLNEKVFAKFSVKNISTVPTYLKMVFKESSYFSIKLNRDQPLSRLAPGMSVSFSVTFMPTQMEDYIHKIVFYTDMDQYVLPVIAMGPRPLFNFPDKVTIPKVPLKVESNFSLIVRNVGMVPSGFTLGTKCPFSVEPKSAFLHCDEKIELKITFKTMHLGSAQGVLRVTFESGEILKIQLLGTAHAVALELEKQVIRVAETYNGLVRQETLKITNRSDYILSYICMKNEHVYYDFKDKVKLATAFYDLKESEVTKCAKLIRYDVLSSVEHERVYTRIFYDEVQALVADEQLFFHNTHYSILPMKGNLWPNKTTELTITFSPKEIGELEAIVYLDIDGVADRLPLKIIGISLPPTIHLNVETLNMDYVYINKEYNYEIVAINRGHIDGEIVYKSTATLFESKITCTPEYRFLRPGNKDTFIVSFLNSNPGPFFEEINYFIRNTGVILKVYLKGEVIYPSIIFSVSSLDFGDVSLGVPKTLILDIINESNVEVGGIVKIPSDGWEINSITLSDYAAADNPKPEISKWPKEFRIEPSKIKIDPETAMSLKITLTANLIRENQTALELEFEKSDKRPMTLPVRYNAMVPQITPSSDIQLRACFLDYPYVNEICISSVGFHGYFTIEELKSLNIDVAINVTEGFIEPNTKICLVITIKAIALGDFEFPLRLHLFGVAEPNEVCRIKGYGISPIVTCNPTTLHWGQVQLLRRSQKILTLCNDSPVQVIFKILLLSHDCKWQVEPTEGVIEPESEKNLIVSLYLVDAETYTSKVVIHLENIKDILVPLSVTGIGTSIVVGDLSDRIELGHHFTKIALNYKLVMENRGTRLHALEWSEHYKTSKNKQNTMAFFNLEPRSFKMNAGEKIDITITAISNKEALIKEIWYLVGSIEGVNKKELLLECKITAEFVDPKIELSSNVMEFRYDNGPYDEFYKLTDLLMIKNISTLPLDLEINTRPPFALIQCQNTCKILPHQENFCHCIYIKDSDFKLSTIGSSDREPECNKFIDFVTLKSLHPLRQESLHFFEDISKIERAFNLTYSVEQHLEDQEIMKIQILFDTTKHTSLKSRIYSDSMKIKFKGHKNKVSKGHCIRRDSVKLCGKINFPNILVLTPKIDFQCLLNDSVESKTIKIQNVTPLMACYRFNWKKVSVTPISKTLEQINFERNFIEENKLTFKRKRSTPSINSFCPSEEKSININVSVVSETRVKMNNNLNEKIIKTITPMLSNEYETKFKWMYKFPEVNTYYDDHINDILLITPSRGKLKPAEIQYVNVMFQPQNNVNVRAVLECQVLGGPSELITITGQSSDLMFELSAHKINMKIRSFHENAYEYMQVSNKSLLPFDIKSYLNEPKFDSELYGTILDIIPPEKTLQSEETVDIKILVRPGVLGYFKREFLLEIGHLPTISIEVVGWGVIPQVYLSIQRPNLSESHPTIGYLAIATLTFEYLDAVNMMFRKHTSEHLNSPLTENCLEDPMFQHDWHICSPWDAYPSIMDIEMSIERVLLLDYLKIHPELIGVHRTVTKMKPFSGFSTIPYIVDFGVIITGSTTSRALDVFNYGPLTVKLYLSKNTVLPEWLNIKLCGKLYPGEIGHIDVTLTSDSENFPEPEQNVETCINFEVPYGITIPVKFMALCAVPCLATSVTLIDFGPVKCGNKVIISIPIKNIGKPICIWYATLKLKSLGANQISILNSSGKYEAGESGWLSVAFKPTMEISYEGLLIFRFHMNPKRMTIPIVGYGIMPQVHIIGPNISFPPTLPWAETTEHFFGLTNPCPFPIELIVAHSDIKWNEEEEIYQLLEKFYNKPEEMLVPAIKPAAGLPSEILTFYKLIKERVKKCLDEEGSALKTTTLKASSAKKAKSPRHASKTSARSQEISPRRQRTEAEIIADELRLLRANNVDPLKDCVGQMNLVFPESESESNSNGLIILFHGSPGEEEQCQEIAYSVGKTLNLPTLSIDFCFVEALCVCSNPAKDTLTKVIDEMFEISKIAMVKDDQVENEEDQEEFYDSSDEFAMFMKKIEVITNNKALTTPKSKSSEKKKKKSTSSFVSQAVLDAMTSSTMFNLELIQELMTDFFNLPKFNHGFIIESLTSVILKSPPIALTTILKCKPMITNLHLVLCQSNFNRWAQAYEETLKEELFVEESNLKVYDDNEIQAIINYVENMDDDEYENMDPELKTIYITHGLENRRRNFLQRMGITSDLGKKEKEVKDRSTKSLLAVDGFESKKKLKKDDVKSKPPSEYLAMNTKYNEYYKTVYDNLISIANNWIADQGDLGYPLVGLNGQILGQNMKKVRKKSDIHIQLLDESSNSRGFPLTLIMCPCIRYKEAIVNMFAFSDVVKNVLKTAEKPDILKFPIQRKEYSVLLPKIYPNMHDEESLTWYYLDESIIKKCECNIINNLNIIDDSAQENVLNILSKWHCTCGKKMTSSQTSTTEIPLTSSAKFSIADSKTDELYPLPLGKVKSIFRREERLVLQPGDLMRCKYTFSPKVEGIYYVKRFVQVNGWPASQIPITVNGICDIPRLDSRPKKMFKDFVRRTIEDSIYKVTYLDDYKLFQFGPIFVGVNRIYEENYAIELKNCSLIKADIEVELLRETDVFRFDKKTLVLEPENRDKLVISAAPAEVGQHTNVLMFCVKNNPEIVTVNIACSGVVPVVEVLPSTKMIDYGKHLLYRQKDDRFIVKNDSILPIMWKVRNIDDFQEDFIISQSSGVIPRYDNQVVSVTYIACQVGVISNKMLTVDVYDAEGRGDPMIVDSLYLSAECYDVMVEFAYENDENLLNFGNVKVNSTVVRDMYLFNRGKYNIYYKLKKVKSFPEPALLKSFEVAPECGVLPPSTKVVTVEFECTPTASLNIVNVPAYICTLLDGNKNQMIVAKFPICVTIASFYNTFTLFPLGELNFHVQPVGIGVVREVILNNTSKCPFTYEIILPPEYQPGSSVVSTPKVKDNKIKNPPMKCGNFVIMNEDNLLAPSTSRTIQIQFLASAAKKFEEVIHFVISDTCPAEAKGVPLRLVGTGALPTLDFWNLETTFREHLIVQNMTEYRIPEPSPHCVFAEDTVTLHFFGVIVNTSHSAAIDLYNSGLVPCALNMKLHYQANSSQEIFYLDKYETYIEPLMHKKLNITFKPKTLEVYKAVLEVILKKLEGQVQTFRICLIGEGVIPRIRLTSPLVKNNRLALLQFPVTCLSSVTSRKISFENVSSVNSTVIVNVIAPTKEDRPLFWIAPTTESDNTFLNVNVNTNDKRKFTLSPKEKVTLQMHYSPLQKGKASCDVKLTVVDNPFENFTIMCEAEAFMEDVILQGLEMLSMDIDLEAYKLSTNRSSSSATDNKRKSKSSSDKKKLKFLDSKKSKRYSQASIKHSETSSTEPPILKYLLDFGGCELCAMQKRSVIMINNSEKVYKFTWNESEYIVVRPTAGFISPGEEKDLEIIFFSSQPVNIEKESLSCSLNIVSDDYLTTDSKEITWDTRQTVTLFDRNRDAGLNERYDMIFDEQITTLATGDIYGNINIVIIYSAKTEYTKYITNLEEEKILQDTFIYQTRSFNFKVENIGKVQMKIAWNFVIDDEFPTRLKKSAIEEIQNMSGSSENIRSIEKVMKEELPIDRGIELVNNDPSKMTLFSGSIDRESVDTWFEVDLPFRIVPEKACIRPRENEVFKVTFSPLDAFLFKVRLQSTIDNLDPYDQNITCKLTAKSFIPYVHLDIEESDYLTSGRRKTAGVALPPHTTVLEFNVLGPGCHKKSFNVINPTSEAYEFMFEVVMTEVHEFVPVHCNKLKGHVEGGTSTEVVFSFSPTASGVYESHWKFIIPDYSLVMNLLVVGFVREPDVAFVPTILVIRNLLVGFTSENIVRLKNNEEESLSFEFKGNSLCDESGETPVTVLPERGVLKPRSETPINIIYRPVQDGPLSFKIFCYVKHLSKLLTLCVNALSYSIKPIVTYYLVGNEHVLRSKADTNIHLDKTASTYERTIPFTIKNDGSATFFYDWHYSSTPVKKYLKVNVEPSSGHVSPGSEVQCIVYFNLKQVPVHAFPISLSIVDGPQYDIYLHAEIEKPKYHFSCMDFDFGKCIVNAPDTTYRKNIAFENRDNVPLTVDLNFTNLPELYVQYNKESLVQPNQRLKISFYFRPKEVKVYEFKLQFWVNSMCEEVVIIKGEGVPLLFDLYDGCQKSFDLGPVKVGDKIVRQIEVMNHSKIQIEASFSFNETYNLSEDTNESEATSLCLSNRGDKHEIDPGQARGKMLQNYKENKIKEQIALDVQNALSSLKVVPNKCIIEPYRKVPLKIQFKPVGIIRNLNVQVPLISLPSFLLFQLSKNELNMRVFQFERPLVQLSGSATGMSLCLSQNSLQFGRVRKRGCKILKVMLINKGDFSARFWWQPLKTDEFTISPLQGNIAARSNVTFTVTFRPVHNNPFIKVWASCHIENYMPLELALYATCIDTGNFQNKTVYMECPVREVQTEHIVVTNPTDEMWLILSEVTGESFVTLKEIIIEANTTFEIPIHFKPKSFGKHEGQILFSPLGESALFINLVGIATHPNPNGDISLNVKAKDLHTEELLVYNITEFPESYVVSSEIVKVCPEKFDGYYEINHPEIIKVWGEASATCRWSFVCYEEGEIHIKVTFTNEQTLEYQFYNIKVIITPSGLTGMMTFESRARESVQKELSISNPLAEDAEFNVRSESLESINVLKINRNSKATLALTYSPLVVGEREEYLEVYNSLVGTYLYKVTLKCLPAKEKNLEFTTPLGTRVPLRLRAHNKTDTITKFHVTSSHPSIIINDEFTLDAFEKGKFNAWFEPIETGCQLCRVSLKSESAGEFVYNIKGTATEPKPQGPFIVESGGYTVITFKNVFEDSRVFKLNVDREEFFVKSFYESVKAKKDLKVPVYLTERPVEGWKEIPTGCLTIECHEPAEPKVHWTYFLQGKP